MVQNTRRSDTIFLAGCTLVTDTMDKILAQCQGKKVIVYGGTAAFIPDALLGKGVCAIRHDLLENYAGAVERFFPLASENMIIVNA